MAKYVPRGIPTVMTNKPELIENILRNTDDWTRAELESYNINQLAEIWRERW